MINCIGFIVFLVMIACVSVWAVIEFSKPAPDWVDDDDRRRGWYK